jgi:hypothetical protein
MTELLPNEAVNAKNQKYKIMRLEEEERVKNRCRFGYFIETFALPKSDAEHLKMQVKKVKRQDDRDASATHVLTLLPSQTKSGHAFTIFLGQEFRLG